MKSHFEKNDPVIYGLNRKHANFVLITKKINVLIQATQFSTMDGPVGDPWI